MINVHYFRNISLMSANREWELQLWAEIQIQVYVINPN